MTGRTGTPTKIGLDVGFPQSNDEPASSAARVGIARAPMTHYELEHKPERTTPCPTSPPHHAPTTDVLSFNRAPIIHTNHGPAANNADTTSEPHSPPPKKNDDANGYSVDGTASATSATQTQPTKSTTSSRSPKEEQTPTTTSDRSTPTRATPASPSSNADAESTELAAVPERPGDRRGRNGLSGSMRTTCVHGPLGNRNVLSGLSGGVS